MTHSKLRPPPALAGLPRLLVQALPAVSLTFLAMTVGSLPAQAGHWVLTTTGSGKAAVNGNGFAQTFTAPPPTTGSVSIGQLATGYGNGPTFGGNGPTLTAAANLSVTVTGTWTNDTNSDNTAPPSILYSVSSTANANSNTNGGPVQPGTANDGYADGAPPGSPIGTSATPGIKYVAGSGSFTISLTLSASASGNAGPNGGGGANASVGPITIGVHAQPYNYHKTSQSDNKNGTISFTYDWLSTTGNKADLTSCSWHENVTYPGATGPRSYFPPSCFANPSGLDNPTISPSPGTASMASTICTDTHYTFNVSSFYVYTTVTASQRYEFDDSVTGQTNVLIPGPSSTASIVRTVTNTGTPSPSFNAWYYSVSKQGLTAWLQLP